MDPIPVVDHAAVLAAVSPTDAIERVGHAFMAHARGDWAMPPKVYLDTPPGDFRAMPAAGDGIAMIKWVTSFPTNPQRGLPTVFGTIVASDARDGRPLALIDGRAVTALRTGASAAVATRALARDPAQQVGVIGCGLHGAWSARCLAAAGSSRGICYDPDPHAAENLAGELGWVSGTLEAALACEILVTVTPGNEPVIRGDDLHPGMHVNALGADAPSKAELTIDAVKRCKLFCDDWEQASHGGELHGAVSSGAVTRSDVTDIGRVLTDQEPGRESPDEITLFDSTGLAIQDLAIVHALMDALAEGLEVPSVSL